MVRAGPCIEGCLAAPWASTYLRPVTPNLFPAPAVTIKMSPDTANVPGGGGAKFQTDRQEPLDQTDQGFITNIKLPEGRICSAQPRL